MYSILLLVSMFFFDSPDYKKIFGTDYDTATLFVKQNKQLIAMSCTRYNTDTAEVISTVFPELIRYSMVRDYFETKALEVVYIDYGSDYADFSIGRFQMKPSFVEKLEAYIRNTSGLDNPLLVQICTYPSELPTLIRKQRIERLRSLDWQLKYINCFYIVVTNKFANNHWLSNIDKLRFIATAYNTGFEKSFDDINKCMQAKLFPFGKVPVGASTYVTQYPYCDVAAFFYSHHYPQIFSK